MFISPFLGGPARDKAGMRDENTRVPGFHLIHYVNKFNLEDAMIGFKGTPLLEAQTRQRSSSTLSLSISNVRVRPLESAREP